MNLSKPSIILVRPQLPENIGMVARAMNNFGLKKLILVCPRDRWPNKKALDSAKHAKKIIENCKVYYDLNKALNPYKLVVATTNRKRFLQKKIFYSFIDLQDSLNKNSNIAIMFGPENSGLSNYDLRLADFIFTIPTNNLNKSLNLSHAVSIVAYKLFEITMKYKDFNKNNNKSSKEQASKNDLNKFVNYLVKSLDGNNFFVPLEKKESMIDNIYAIYLKANLTNKELNTLWGITKKLSK
ncbi:MAG: hypothetical protein CMI96_01625 [Pelagibacteraceae bacterium]|nr:hypothetical protein [Pelagibacteraceae bacterium]